MQTRTYRAFLDPFTGGDIAPVLTETRFANVGEMVSYVQRLSSPVLAPVPLPDGTVVRMAVDKDRFAHEMASKYEGRGVPFTVSRYEQDGVIRFELHPDAEGLAHARPL